jgi:hypothetical protein
MLRRMIVRTADQQEEPNPILGVLITLAIEVVWSVVVIGGWLWLKGLP